MQILLHQLTLRICVIWKSSRKKEVKLKVFWDPGFHYVSGQWIGFDVDVGGIFPVSVNYFHISIDITVHRTYMIPNVTGRLSCYMIGWRRVSVS